MSAIHKLVIKNGNPEQPVTTKTLEVFLDDQKVKGLTRLEFVADAASPSLVTVHLQMLVNLEVSDLFLTSGDRIAPQKKTP